MPDTLTKEQKSINDVMMSRRLAKIALILREKLGIRYDDFVSKWTTSGLAFDDLPTGVKTIIRDAENINSED